MRVSSSLTKLRVIVYNYDSESTGRSGDEQRDGSYRLENAYVPDRPRMSLFAVIREAGPTWQAGGIFEQPSVTEHAAFMNTLADQRFVLFGGPLAGTEQGYVRVLLIVDADSEAAIDSRLWTPICRRAPSAYVGASTAGPNQWELRAALEPCLQLLQIPGHLCPRLPPHEERHEQPADPVALEVERDRHARTIAVPERLDGALDDPPDRAVDTANGPAARTIQLGELHRHRPLARTDPPGHDGPRAHGGSDVALPARGHRALLPLGETRRIGHVLEDVFGTTRDLDTLDDCGHLASFETILGVLVLVVAAPPLVGLGLRVAGG